MIEGLAIPVFSVLTVIAAAAAILFSDTRKVIISSWVAAMSVGALFLACGAEFLAFIQWIMGTLVAISFVVYATFFGEYSSVDSRSLRQRIFDGVPAILVGLAFFGMIALALGDLAGTHASATAAAASAAARADSSSSNDLLSVGRNLAERHVISLELVAFMLLAVLIGAGVVSRGEPGESSASDEGGTT